jgi:hypothetical protein
MSRFIEDGGATTIDTGPQQFPQPLPRRRRILAPAMVGLARRGGAGTFRYYADIGEARACLQLVTVGSGPSFLALFLRAPAPSWRMRAWDLAVSISASPEERPFHVV